RSKLEPETHVPFTFFYIKLELTKARHKKARISGLFCGS
ncbi:MAG: hypothetical protein ACI87Q_001870, partial [Pseudohongiellaceae bacterium]